MTNKLPTDQQMTDVFGRFHSPLPPVGEVPGPKINNRNKTLLGAAAVLLGSGAAFAAINFDAISAFAEGGGASADSPAPETVEGKVPSGAASTHTPLQHHTASAVQNGTITPNENIAIADQVEEQMTFGQAYAAAREETGPGGIFSWHGQVYNTYTVEEWQGLSLGQRQEFLSDVGYQPMQSTELTQEESPALPIEETGEIGPIARDDSDEGTFTDEEDTDAGSGEVGPSYIDLVINGRPALGIDDDHDGIANAIVFVDEESANLLAFVDAEGDNRLDTAIQFDPVRQQIVGQQAIEEPFVAEMSQLESMSGLVDEPIASYVALEDSEGTFDDDDNDYTDDDGYVNDAELPEMD